MSAQVSLTRPTTIQQSQNRRPAFVPPPRFQQLKAADQLQQQYSNLRYSYTDQGEFNHPVSMAPVSAPQRPTMPNQNHSRTSSFFSFRNKHQAVDATVDAQTNSAHQRSASTDETATSYSSTSPRPIASPPMQARPLLSPNVPQQRPANTNSSSTLVRHGSQSNSNTQPAPPPLHPEIRSVVQLTVAHAHKIYFSGPLVRRIERQPDGQRPGKDEGWTEVWAQLGGTTLSVWDMKEIQEASKQGKEVPPSYVNVTDAFVQVLGSVTVPATSTSAAKRYTNVLTLNTAGSNLLLFSCPSTASLISWAAALRLSAWEKSRLEEIYTAHLIRITISARDSPTTLIRGQMEGWVQIRVAGQTDWKRVWMVVSSVADTASKLEKNGENGNGIGAAPTPTATQKKKRMSSLFSRETSPMHSPLPSKPLVAIYPSNKPKDKKKPLLTMTDVTQAFSVYPERPELISRSTLIKLEGTLGDEELAGTMRSREVWVLVMPELEGGMGQAPEMLKWVVSFHDAFSMYGRPKAWTWDPRDPDSLMFAYPVGPHKDLLFLDRELVEALDPRDDRTSAIRSRLLGILLERMRGNDDRPSTQTSPARSAGAAPSQTPGAPGTPGPQLPPLSFDRVAGSPERTPLTPITEASHLPHAGRSSSSSLSKRIEPPPAPTPAPAPTPVPAPARSVTPPVTNVVKQSMPSTLSVNPRIDSSKSSEMNGTSPSTPGALRNSMLDPDMSPSPLSASTASPPTATAPSAWNSNTNSFRARASIAEDPRFSHDTISLADNMSILTSPYSNMGHRETNRFGSISGISGLSSMNGTPASPSTQSVFTRVTDFAQEPGALYYMSQDSPIPPPDDNLPEDNIDLLRKSEHAFEHEPASEQQKPEGREDDGVFGSRHHDPPISPSPPDFSSNRPFSTRQNVPITSLERKTSERTSVSSTQQSATSSNPADRLSPTLRAGLGRKPSGARAPTAHRVFNGDVISSSHQLAEEDELQDDTNMDKTKEIEKPSGPTASASHDEQSHDEEALAVLSYLDIYDDDGSAAPPINRLIVSSPSIMSNLTSSPLPSPQAATEPSENQFKSSFAPSKQAAERKAKAQAQQAAQQAAAHKPGRVDGQRKSKGGNGTWHESSDEDSDEDGESDDDDDDADSDVAPATAALSNQNTGQNQNPVNSANKFSNPGQLQTLEPQHSGSAQHQRPPRTLPQIPGRQLEENQSQPNRRMIPDQFAESVRRTHYDDGTPIRTQAEFPRPGAARQTVWSQVLDPGRGTLGEGQQPSKDTFVTLEPAETMTKAFTPQGLLSAGLQDKEDRSAKRQEELARGTGASLINVPNKPPPPQTGLLGAITAHERERKRDGGVGAALTEREREKRLVEERQRRFDDQQRQQLDQMQQGGSMYGGQFGGYNPMMANPMMMNMMGMNPMMTGGGMNPMMTGGGMSPMAPMMTGQMGQVGQMGFPGMMPGYNPQHLFAAQQAAQAYQQAMMAFSVAGSQAGEGAGGGPSQPLLPNMTGGNMAGFDPRMSMMGMPMMGGPQMGGPQMGGPLGMQMTGMSGFDPRFSPGHTPTNIVDPGLLPPTTMAPGQYSPRNSSPRHGSPLGRSGENGDSGRVSRSSTPNHNPSK